MLDIVMVSSKMLTMSFNKKNAAKNGSDGGNARAKKLSRERRAAIARKAARARWKHRWCSCWKPKIQPGQDQVCLGCGKRSGPKRSDR